MGVSGGNARGVCDPGLGWMHVMDRPGAFRRLFSSLSSAQHAGGPLLQNRRRVSFGLVQLTASESRAHRQQVSSKDINSSSKSSWLAWTPGSRVCWGQADPAAPVCTSCLPAVQPHGEARGVDPAAG
jgi:hypothetical protein